MTTGPWILTGSRKEHASASYLWISPLLKVVLSLGCVEEVRGVVHDSQQFRQPPLPSPPPGWQLWACFFSQWASYVSTPGFQHTAATKKVLAVKFDRASGASGGIHWNLAQARPCWVTSSALVDSQVSEFDQFLLYFTPVHFILRICFMATFLFSISTVPCDIWMMKRLTAVKRLFLFLWRMKNKQTHSLYGLGFFYQKLLTILCRKVQVDKWESSQILCNMNK